MVGHVVGLTGWINSRNQIGVDLRRVSQVLQSGDHHLRFTVRQRMSDVMLIDLENTRRIAASGLGSVVGLVIGGLLLEERHHNLNVLILRRPVIDPRLTHRWQSNIDGPILYHEVMLEMRYSCGITLCITIAASAIWTTSHPSQSN